MKITNDYVLFWGSFLSNFQECKIEYAGREFKSSEQLFMWFKAEYFKDHSTADLILNALTPKDAKNLGRQVKNYDDKVWDMVRYDFMKTAVYEKFNQNPDLKKKLLDPELDGKLFVEASPYDCIWGVGVGEDEAVNPKKWRGKNLLGKILGEVREELN